jgi:hypothetical protein
MSGINVVEKEEELKPNKTWREIGTETITVDVNKLWAMSKDLPIHQFSTRAFFWILDEDFWEDPRDYTKSITPKQVMKNPELYPEHMKRINHANYKKYPLMVRWDGNNWDVLDGLHRLVKAIQDKEEHIPVRVIPDDMFYKAEIVK